MHQLRGLQAFRLTSISTEYCCLVDSRPPMHSVYESPQTMFILLERENLALEHDNEAAGYENPQRRHFCLMWHYYMKSAMV